MLSFTDALWVRFVICKSAASLFLSAVAEVRGAGEAEAKEDEGEPFLPF